MNFTFSVEGQLLVKHSWSLAVCSYTLSKVRVVSLGKKGNACHTLYFSLPFLLRADIPGKKKKICVLHCIWFKLFRTAAVSCALCLILRFNILNPLAYKFIMFYIYQIMQMSMYFPLSCSKLIPNCTKARLIYRISLSHYVHKKENIANRKRKLRSTFIYREFFQ